MGFVFGQTKLDTVTGIVKLHNPTSKRVLEKAGFVHVRQVKLADGEMYFELERRKTVRAGEPGIGAKHDVCLRRAVEEDTETLAAIMKKTFDREIEKWLAGCEQEGQRHLCPPGYDSVEMHRYLARELHYYAVVAAQRIIGGVSVQWSGRRHARLDKLFIDPDYQGSGIGSEVLSLIEAELPMVELWKLETSSKQAGNHRFYEKAGYVRLYESEWEFGYEKQKAGLADRTGARGRLQPGAEQQNLGRMELANCGMNDADFYGMQMERGSYTNSNLADSSFTDCNLSGSKFSNLNLTQTLFADLRLGGSELRISVVSAKRKSKQKYSYDD